MWAQWRSTGSASTPAISRRQGRAAEAGRIFDRFPGRTMVEETPCLLVRSWQAFCHPRFDGCGPQPIPSTRARLKPSSSFEANTAQWRPTVETVVRVAPEERKAWQERTSFGLHPPSSVGVNARAIVQYFPSELRERSFRAVSHTYGQHRCGGLNPPGATGSTFFARTRLGRST